jgi:dipeptidyl-peptidase 4
MFKKSQKPASQLLTALVLAVSVGAQSAFSQISELPDWQTTFRSRMQAIYERGEWRSRPFDGQWLPDSTAYVVTQTLGNNENRTTCYDVNTGQPIETPRGEQPDPLLSPNGQTILERQGTSLWVRELSDGSRRQITEPVGERIVHYRNLSWSPNGEQILFTEVDESDVRKRSVLVPADPSYPEVREDRFARIGESISKLRVGVFNTRTDTSQWLALETPAEGFYLGQVEWAGNDREVLVETLSRFRDRHEFVIVDVEKNQAKVIYSQTDAAWADASQGKNQGLIWLQDGQQFIVLSEKDGWRHAFLYSRDGQEIANLTPGQYDIIERGIVDEALGYFYFYASPKNATQKYLYRVPLDGSGALEQVTPQDQPGTHDYKFSPNAQWAFHTYSTFDTPPIVDLVQLPAHRSVRVLEDNSELRQRASSFALNPTEFLQLEIQADVTVDAWLMKPRDFDASKKYPVFVYVYGEPHAQTVLDSWGTAQDQFHRAVADLGYVVVSIDNRGTPAPKGAAWRRSIFGSLGPLSTEEQAVALQELARKNSYVDLSRVGIWGWSGGGSNTLNAMFRKPERYHVGIAVVPKPQPHLYNAWFQEIYMRTPEVNPEGYKTSAPINYAAGLQGKLLIITGSGETNTHIQIIEGLVDRLIELGKPFDYMVYPNRDHGLREGKGSEVHVRMLIMRYLMDNLPPGGR